MSGGFDVAARALALNGQRMAADVRRLARQQMASAGRHRFDPNPASPLGVATAGMATGVGAATTCDANGTAYPWSAPQYAWNGGRLSYLGCVTQTYNATAGQAAHIRSDGVVRGPGHHRIRFVTNAPSVVLHVYAAQGTETVPCVMVDGAFVTLVPAPGAYLSSPTTNKYNFYTMTFASAPARFEIGSRATVSGGSGYTEGDLLTLVGGSGRAATMLVTRTASGAVAASTIVDGGDYAIFPTGTVTATGGSGSGASFTLEPRRLRGWVQMRTVELFASGSFMLAGVSVGAGYDIQPAPATGPRILFQGDSFTEGTGAARGRIWWQQAARRLGFDDYWGVGVGSTGFVANGIGSRINFGGRIADVLDPRPDVVVTSGSINDNVHPVATIAANVSSYYRRLRAGLPEAVLVAIDPWNAPGSVTSAARYAAYRDGVADANAGGARVAHVRSDDWIVNAGNELSPGTAGNTGWLIGSDNAHPTPAGHDWLGFMTAEAMRSVLAGI